jgi:hypothetical protein
MRWKYKGPIYSSLGQDGQSEQDMGILGRINDFLEVDHGPVTNKTQLYLTKYVLILVPRLCLQ